MRKIYLLTALFLVICVCLPEGCAKKPVKKKPIKIAINVWPGYAYTFIAEEKGIFKQNGVDVELILKKDYGQCKELLKNGEADAAFMVFPDVILAAARGLDYKAVYIADFSLTADVIVSRSEFQSISDLKGKTVSFDGINTFSHIFVLQVLEKYGVKESEMKFKVINALDVLDALEKGEIDAGHTWEPVVSQVVKKGYKILAKADEIPVGVIVDMLVFRKQTIEERPGEVGLVVKSIFEALDYLKNNPEEAVEIMAGRENMSQDEMVEGLKGVNQPDLLENFVLLTKKSSLYDSGKMIMDFYTNRGQLSRIIEIKEVIESRFVKELSNK
jgi:NitT/TauT family transport system substrate-binding protein